MSQHMVIFQNPDGDQGYNQFESIDDAVSFVEKIRNEQGIDSIRIFELQEVKFDLKPYYKVELQALTRGSSSSASEPSTPSAPSTPSQPAAASPAPAAAPSPEPAPAPAPSSAPSEPTSTSPFAPPAGGGSSAPPPPAPTPPADEPSSDDQPTRRGLFGR